MPPIMGCELLPVGKFFPEMSDSPAAARWYFDVVSPYAYLYLKQFHRLPAALEIEFVPVLFAGLLKHWGQKGPAEIPGKRLQAYRHCIWYAARHGIPFRMPPRHPFNPLSALRLIVAQGATRPVVEQVFDFVFLEGRDLGDPTEWRALCARLGADEADLRRPDIKQRLAADTDAAARAGVFGVPTLGWQGELFWGCESIDLVNDFAANPRLFEGSEMRRVATLPVGAERPR